MNSTTENAKRIAFLDYLRIFAFISVLIGHKFFGPVEAIANDPSKHATLRFFASMLAPLFDSGGAGVVVFFLVSGYIVTNVLESAKPLEFLIKRAFRIYPLYVVAVLASYFITFLVHGQIPQLSILIPQLLLIGDFFGTPYTLNGVEWTLRVEVTFYMVMAVVVKLGFFARLRPYFPFAIWLLAIACFIIRPIPSEGFSTGYLNIYGPFLLVGVMFYLFEKKDVTLTFLIAFTLWVFWQHFSLISSIQSNWLGHHFAFLAFMIFAVAWFCRGAIAPTWYSTPLSDLTYAMYLLHNWLFDYFKHFLMRSGISGYVDDVLALLLLVVACYLGTRWIEKPFIKLGRKLSNRLTQRDTAPALQL